MNTYPYPWNSFFSMVIPLVFVPALIGVLLIWWLTRRESAIPVFSNVSRPRVGWLTGGRFGRWVTGILGGVLGFLAGALGLSWSGPVKGGGFEAPQLPAPGEWPVWQVILCGAVVVGMAVFASLTSRWLMAGAMAAGLGTATGFSTFFAAGVASPVTSQEGIGVMMAMGGTSLSLCVINLIIASKREEKIGSRR